MKFFFHSFMKTTIRINEGILIYVSVGKIINPYDIELIIRNYIFGLEKAKKNER